MDSWVQLASSYWVIDTAEHSARIDARQIKFKVEIIELNAMTKEDDYCPKNINSRRTSPPDTLRSMVCSPELLTHVLYLNPSPPESVQISRGLYYEHSGEYCVIVSTYPHLLLFVYLTGP